MKKIMILILLALLFLGACKGITRTKTQPTPVIHTGTEGLTMQFLPGAPPDKVFINQFFQIGVQFQNKGATDIKDGQYLISVEEDVLRLDDRAREPLRIRGKSLFDPAGDFAIRTHGVHTLELPEQSQIRSTTVRVTACYPYQTQATANVCIDTDPLNLRKIRKPCTPTPQSLGGGQGAPVAITNVVPEMRPTQDQSIVQPFFTITIANLGNGQVFAKERTSQACSASPLGEEDINVVRISAKLGEIPLKCNPEKPRLTRENIVQCGLEEGIGTDLGTFVSQLTVIIDYGYTFTISKGITIQRPVG